MSEGRCPFATWIGSPNFGYPRGTHGQLKPLAICDHIMCGTLVGCDSWFKNPNAWVSAHFGIGKNGDIHQYVDLDDCAWANGVINKPDPAIAHLYTNYNPNVVTWSIEHEGWPEDKWTEEMLQADVKLKRWLYRRRPGIILVGHYQFDSVNKANCPGPNWPRELLAAKMIAGTEEEMKPPLYRIEGKPEVYYAAGGKLFHAKNQATFLALGYKSTDVTVLPAKNVIWNLPVEYPGGVPAELR